MNEKLRTMIVVVAGSVTGFAMAVSPVSAWTPEAATCLSDSEHTDVTRAEKLRSEAMQLFRSGGGWSDIAKRASGLLEESAELRSPCDPEVHRSLVLAGGLRAHLGDVSSARKLMSSAAERALRIGDVRAAAHAFLNTAQLAVREGDAAAAKLAVRQADLLSGSPMLSATDRRLIRSRFESSAELANQERDSATVR